MCSKTETIVWNNRGTLEADIYHPGNGDKVPIILLFHGGAFLRFDRTAVRQQARYFQLRGYLVCAPDYRMLSDASATVRDALDDAFEVLTWVASRAVEWSADPARIVVMGNSAGGSLAAMLHLQARSKEYRICGAVLNYPLTDFVHSAREGFEALKNPLWAKAGIAPRGIFRGGETVDANVALYEAVSPVYNVPSEGDLPPVLAWVGANDRVSPLSAVEAYVVKLRVVGTKATLRVASDEAHDFLRPAACFDTRHRSTMSTTDRFVDLCAKPRSSLFVPGSLLVAATTAIVVVLVGVRLRIWDKTNVRSACAFSFVITLAWTLTRRFGEKRRTRPTDGRDARFHGTWYLVPGGWTETEAGTTIHPLGQAARGVLIYSPEGIMSANIVAEASGDEDNDAGAGPLAWQEREAAARRTMMYAAPYRTEGHVVYHETSITQVALHLPARLIDRRYEFAFRDENRRLILTGNVDGADCRVELARCGCHL